MEYQEAFERMRETLVKLVNRIKEAFMRIVKWFKSTTQKVIEFVEIYEVEQEKVNPLRHSWIVKRDTRRASQVICNKPRVMVPRIRH